MLVELRHVRGDRLIHRVDLEDPPQPGRWLVVEQQSFLVMPPISITRTFESYLVSNILSNIPISLLKFLIVDEENFIT